MRRKVFLPTRPLRDATNVIVANEDQKEFLPTRPLRDATPSAVRAGASSRFLPTRPLRDATRIFLGCPRRRKCFYPRVPCGTRLFHRLQQLVRPLFLPTRPLRDATLYIHLAGVCINVSTHASLAGRDVRRAGRTAQHPVSTHASLAGRDPRPPRGEVQPRVSTHASLAGRDDGRAAGGRDDACFYPRVPCGTRQLEKRAAAGDVAVSTHASLAGRDAAEVWGVLDFDPFLPTRPLRDATRSTAAAGAAASFYPRVPCGTRQQI